MGHPVARSRYTASELDFLEAQKQTERPNEIIQRTTSLGELIIRVLGRGEVAYVQSGTKAMLVEAFPGIGEISRRSVKQWDDGTKPTEDEREEIVEAFFDVFRRLGHSNPKAS
jgi:ArsR family metal-binding transcriptional regulator